MKKVALLISFMLIFTFTSFAQVDVTVEGSSTVTLGVSFDEPVASGFMNENSAKISFSLGSGTAEKGDDADVHGYISIGEWKVNCEDELDADPSWTIETGDVNAQINFGAHFVKISGTTNGFNFVDPVQDDDADPDNADPGSVNTSLDNSGGIVLGLGFAPFGVEIGIFSQNDWSQDDDSSAVAYELSWTDDDGDGAVTEAELDGTVTDAVAATANRNDDNVYGASVKLTADLAPLSVEIGAVMGINYPEGTPVGIGGKISADLAPLSVYVAADVELVTDVDPAMEFAGGLSLALADGLSLAVDGSYSDAAVDNTDVKISITEDGDGGVVPALGASVAFELYNLLDSDVAADSPDDADAAAEWALDATVDYNLGTIKPYLGVRYGTYTVTDDAYTYTADTQEPFKLNIGAEIYLITNVTLVVDYNSDDLSSDAKSNGVLKLQAKIEY